MMRRDERIRAAAASVTTCLALLLAAAPANAHARLVSADPAANVTVPPPKVITLRFSEVLARKFSSLRLAAPDGKAVALTAVESREPKIMAAAPVGTLAPGRYTLTWTAVASDDGHKTGGSFTFTVK
jgi:methionine-rich copper-binding protein CopC